MSDDERRARVTHLKPAGSVRVRVRCARAVLLGDPIAGVAVCRVLMAQAAADRPPLLKVGRAALARVAAHTVLPAA